MKDKILRYGLIFLFGMALMFVIKQPGKKIVKVPVKVEVEVPVVEVQYDTVYEPRPIPYLVKKVDTSLIEVYKKANDSLKEVLFKNSVTVNKYKNFFEDSIQTITVSTSVTGKLNSLVVGYKTKPRTITVDTVIPIKVSAKDRFVLPYIESGVPTIIDENSNLVFKGGFDYSGKNNWVFGASYDTEKRIWLKIGKRFNF